MNNLIPNLIVFIMLISMDNDIIKRSKNLKKEKSTKNIEKKWDDITDFIFLISIITVMVIISNITSNLNRSGIIFILFFIIAYILTVYLAIKNKNYAIKKINDKLEQSKKKSLEELREFAINQMYDIVSKLHYVELDKIKEFISTYKNLFEMATTEAELIRYIAKCNACLKLLFDMDDLLRESIERKKADNKKTKKSNTKYSYTVEGALKLFKLDKNASKEEIKAAYRRLVKIHHPDRGGIQDNFIKLNNAYEVLKEYYNI